MTDVHEPSAPAKGTGHPPTKKPGLTPEQIAALSADEKQQLIDELEAALVELRRPAPEPYPKWVEIGGVPMVVESPEEEERKTKADAEFHKEHDKKHEKEHAGKS